MESSLALSYEFLANTNSAKQPKISVMAMLVVAPSATVPCSNVQPRSMTSRSDSIGVAMGDKQSNSFMTGSNDMIGKKPPPEKSWLNVMEMATKNAMKFSLFSAEIRRPKLKKTCEYERFNIDSTYPS